MDAPDDTRRAVLHATCVSVEGRGLLLTGPSGAGKSALALELMGLGARLVADDRTVVERDDGGRLHASCPEEIRCLIEARGVGLLEVDPVADAVIALVADLGRTETLRLPPRRTTIICGVTLPCVQSVGMPHFPAALRQYLLSGRSA